MNPLTTRRSRLSAFAALLFALSLIVSACAGGGGGGGDGGGQGQGGTGSTITIGNIGWEEDVVNNALWKHILERRGYDVKVTTLSANSIYQGLARGDLDLFLDAWLPRTHADKMDRFGKGISKIGVWYENGTLTWTVPSYVTNVNSIPDLKGKAAMFNGQITGIEPSAGLTDLSKNQVIPQYGLGDEYNLKISSTAAMIGALERAVAKKEPIVVTLWHPHLAYTRYELKDLKDPKGALGKGEQLWVLGSKNFPNEHPKITGWLKKFQLSQQQVRELEDLVYNKYGGPEQADKAIDEWASKNQQLINQWAGPPRN